MDYGTFMNMIEVQNIGQVEVGSTKIYFTDKDNMTVYKTGTMTDPTLTERRYEADTTFSQEIKQTVSPMMYTGEESRELIKLLINCLAGIIFLALFRKRRGNVSFKEEPLLIIVLACIYVYSLAGIFARILYERLPVVLICMAFHAAYYILLGYRSKLKPECIEMVSKGK